MDAYIDITYSNIITTHAMQKPVPAMYQVACFKSNIS